MQRKISLPGFSHFPFSLYIAFIIPLLYWTYLFFTSHMQISADAIGYEQLGETLHKNGLIEFLRTGPHREPLYPFTISLSMAIGDLFHLPYQTFQKLFQLALLLLTQFLVLKTLERMDVSKTVCAIVVLYCGLSPVMVNAALSLYSEILTFPLMVGIVLTATSLWEKLQSNLTIDAINKSLTLSFLLIAITFVKGIFEYIGFVFLLVFVMLSFLALINKNRKLFFNTLFSIALIIGIHQMAITSYKYLNLKYNGHYAFTDRGSWLLYGNTARRTLPLDTKKTLALLSLIPGEGVCQSLFSQDACEYWHFRTSDGLGWTKLAQLRSQGVAEPLLDSALIRASLELIRDHPWSYASLMLIESCRMLFWESTQIGFVAYPAWLGNIFNLTLFKNGLRFMLFFLTFAALLSLKLHLWRNRSAMLNPENMDSKTAMILFLLSFIFVYIFFYALVSIVVRFSIPLAPLYLILIGSFLEKLRHKFCHD